MKFEDRKSKAFAAVVSFLSGFAPPRGFDEDARAAHIAGIADAFARRMPVTGETQFAENLEKTFLSIRDNHTGYSWPVQSEFVSAMPQPIAASGGVKISTFSPDDQSSLFAKRLNAGLPVPETLVWGKVAWSLVSGGLVARDILDGYRKASVETCKSAYSGGAYGLLHAKYGEVVTPYFASAESGVTS
jgi:hypothetical protein